MTGPAPEPVTEGSILDAFDLIGAWELPGLDSLQPGRLSYAKNSIMLTVMAPADANTFFQKIRESTAEAPAAIRGVVETGEHVLLDGCLAVDRKFIMNTSDPRPDRNGGKAPGGASVMGRTVYRTKDMYASKAPIPSRPTSTTLSVSYTGLFTWLNNYAISTDIGKDATTITFVPPKQHKTDPLDGLSLTLSYGHSIPLGAPRKEFVLPQSASVIFESASPAGIGWFRPHIMAFANFLMMGSRLPVQPERYVMWRGRDAVMAFPGYLIHPIPAREEGLLGIHFNYQQIAGSFDDAIRRWFSMSKKYEKSMNLYFQTRLAGAAHDSEVRFLRLAQALEAFHRAKHPDAKKREICRMLGDIVRDLPHDVFPSEEERSSFITGVSDTRNYFSHGFLLNKERSVPKGGNLIKMTERAEVLLYGCYLHELQIGDELEADIMRERINLVNSIEVL